MSTHIIHKQHIILNISNQEYSSTVQYAISALLQNGLQEMLENVLDEMAPNGEIIRIDSLQLDLGIIEMQNIEQVFKERLVQEIRKAVIVKQYKAKAESGVTVIHPTQSLRGAFFYFLEHGTLPWYYALNKIADWEAKMLQQFVAKDWQSILVWIKERMFHQPVVINRLATQFSGNVLERILQEANPLEQVDWKMIYNDLMKLFSSVSAGDESNISAKIWSSCLICFLNAPQSLNVFYAVTKECLTQFEMPVEDFVIRSKDIIDDIQSVVICAAIKQIAEEVNSNGEILDSSVNKNEKMPADAPGTYDNDSEERNAAGDIRLHNKKGPAFGNAVGKKYKADNVGIEEEAYYVNNSGIVLLHPFLEMYFNELGLLQKRKFVHEDACKRAVLLLHYLVTGEVEVAEFDLMLQKVLCGFPLEETLPNKLELSNQEKEESEKLLSSVIGYWTPLKNTSIEGLRITFLQREGKLSLIESGWLLTVEQKTVDILLEKLPWGFSTIHLPWMNNLLNVMWR